MCGIYTAATRGAYASASPPCGEPGASVLAAAPAADAGCAAWCWAAAPTCRPDSAAVTGALAAAMYAPATPASGPTPGSAEAGFCSSGTPPRPSSVSATAHRADDGAEWQHRSSDTGNPIAGPLMFRCDSAATRAPPAAASTGGAMLGSPIAARESRCMPASPSDDGSPIAVISAADSGGCMRTNSVSAVLSELQEYNISCAWYGCRSDCRRRKRSGSIGRSAVVSDSGRLDAVDPGGSCASDGGCRRPLPERWRPAGWAYRGEIGCSDALMVPGICTPERVGCSRIGM